MKKGGKAIDRSRMRVYCATVRLILGSFLCILIFFKGLFGFYSSVSFVLDRCEVQGYIYSTLLSRSNILYVYYP